MNKKKALFIEINYKNTLYETHSEVSIMDVAKLMKEIYLFDNQVILSEHNENKPTRENIMSHLNELLEESNNLNEIWIHYMGHSTNVIDEKTEYCKRGLLPIDYEANGFIEDDILKKNIFNFKCKVYIFLDCCYGNYGLNINYSLKMIDGKFIREDNMTKYKYHENNNIFVISMYLGEIKNRKHNYELCNLLSRRFCQFLNKEIYTLTIDKIVMRMYKSLYDENFIYNTAVLSSNRNFNGNSLILNCDCSREKIKEFNIKYNLKKTDKEIKMEKAIFTENRIKTFFLSIGRIDLCNNFNKENINKSDSLVSQYASSKSRSRSLEPVEPLEPLEQKVKTKSVENMKKIYQKQQSNNQVQIQQSDENLILKNQIHKNIIDIEKCLIGEKMFKLSDEYNENKKNYVQKRNIDGLLFQQKKYKRK